MKPVVITESTSRNQVRKFVSRIVEAGSPTAASVLSRPASRLRPYTGCCGGTPSSRPSRREAMDFRTVGEVREFILPLAQGGEVAIRDVKRGWFIEKTQ